ncbi:adenylate cyclase type 6-like protein [Lates japonicus]|uniref:Adenylate cyclase type 6-like protein n=1 Tax=Lates japonicus TaxID=270547 RepID=A0AAD3N775_LATJO|nr:adenylate cyclase type 6-like protein [Lates japonicus]
MKCYQFCFLRLTQVSASVLIFLCTNAIGICTTTPAGVSPRDKPSRRREEDTSRPDCTCRRKTSSRSACCHPSAAKARCHGDEADINAKKEDMMFHKIYIQKHDNVRRSRCFSGCGGNGGGDSETRLQQRSPVRGVTQIGYHGVMRQWNNQSERHCLPV